MNSLQRLSLVGGLMVAFALTGCPGPSNPDTGGTTDVPGADGGPRDTGGVMVDTGPRDTGGPIDTGGGTDTGRDAGGCATASDCPAPTAACQVATCTAGVCGMGPAADGSTCTDTDMCTTAETCTAGACGGTAVVCTPSSACVTAACVPATGCVETPVTDGATCEDGDLCTMADTCTAGACTAGAPVVCADDECDTEMCNSTTGACDLTPEAAGTACLSLVGGSCDGAGACSCGVGALSCGGTCFGMGTCMAGVGACAASGMLVCEATGMAATACNAVAGTPGTETCNNIDDNCDGTVDAFSSACYTGAASTRMVGICRDGMSLCTAGVAGACTGQVLPGTEICGNGIDEDCSGADLVCPVPVNDTCAAAIPVAAGGVIPAAGLTVTGTTVGSTNSTPSCRTNPDVFYSFTLAARSIVYVDSFGSGYDTVVGIADTCAEAAPTCNDDSGCGGLDSQVTRILDPGTHIIEVDGFSGAGAFTLRIQAIQVSGAGSGALPAGMSTWAGTTVGAPATVLAPCGPGATPGAGPENWRFWTTCPADTAGTLTASTCTTSTFDTILYVRNGNGTNSCNDDTCGLQSTLSGPIPAGAGLHVLMVDGFGATDSGAYSIPVTRP